MRSLQQGPAPVYVHACAVGPQGTSIAKELVQNADDSGATRLAFCLDKRQHAAMSTLGPAMAPWQGPALLVYNNSVFSEQDFVSISRIGDSVKRVQVGPCMHALRG